jgi:hypothetical protein
MRIRGRFLTLSSTSRVGLATTVGLSPSSAPAWAAFSFFVSLLHEDLWQALPKAIRTEFSIVSRRLWWGVINLQPLQVIFLLPIRPKSQFFLACASVSLADGYFDLQ